MSKAIITDGAKAVSLTGDEGWTYFSGAPKTTEIEQYSRVAAAFRAYNLKANTVANMPFVIYKGKEEYDNSATWENKVGFLPNPSELLRLDILSLIATNTAYNLRTQDILGYKTKNLVNAVAFSFYPWTNPATGALDYIERHVNGNIERYTPDDPRLVRLWRLDHTTEILPSQNTEAKAIMSAAGQVFYADYWISHFYARGGIPPTVVSLKGAILKDKTETEEKSWTNFFKGVGRWMSNVVRAVNAEAIDVKQLGSSVTDLKNNEVYRQALENIAIGTGMPLSLLLSNSANYATAQTEKATWFDNEIIPLCNWIAYEYNRQVFNPIGLRLEFKPETLDPEQEDETERANAFSVYMDALSKCPTYDLFIGMAETLGLELSDGLKVAAEKYYANKEASKPPLITGQPQPMIAQQEQPKLPPPAEALNTDTVKEVTYSKWLPTLDELEELKVWREVSESRLKKGKSLDFVYEPHYVSLPEYIQSAIITELPEAKTVKDIRNIFRAYIDSKTIIPVYETHDIQALADALNLIADGMSNESHNIL